MPPIYEPVGDRWDVQLSTSLCYYDCGFVFILTQEKISGLYLNGNTAYGP